MRKYNRTKAHVSPRFKYLDDDGKLRSRYWHKVKNASEAGIECLLTIDEYCSLLEDAELKSSDIRRDGHHLARLSDFGSYKVGNCRFVPYRVNLAEMKQVRADPAKISEGLRKYYANNPAGFEGKRHTEKTKARIGKANSAHQKGVGNSQYGTCWIVRAGEERKIKKNELAKFLDKGWRKGRTTSKFNK